MFARWLITERRTRGNPPRTEAELESVTRSRGQMLVTVFLEHARVRLLCSLGLISSEGQGRSEDGYALCAQLAGEPHFVQNGLAKRNRYEYKRPLRRADSSVVERWPYKPVVLGSTPSPPTESSLPGVWGSLVRYIARASRRRRVRERATRRRGARDVNDPLW